MTPTLFFIALWSGMAGYALGPPVVAWLRKEFSQIWGSEPPKRGGMPLTRAYLDRHARELREKESC